MPRGVYKRKSRKLRILSGGRPLREVLLEARHEHHGDFAKNAQVSQDIKTVLRAAGYLSLTPVHTEALDMIALKISRIVSGKAGYADHWKDIRGYAALGEKACD